MVLKEKKNCMYLNLYVRKVTTVIVFHIMHLSAAEVKHQKDIVYILIWTSMNEFPFTKFRLGSTYFYDHGCKFTNCYITNNTDYFDDVTRFDAILFNSIDLHNDLYLPLPANRSTYQKYIFVSQESPVNYPINSNYNNIFNWTWTYKLNSDIVSTYIIVKDMNGKVIGPKFDMHWMNVRNMEKTRKEMVEILKNKTTAVAWFVSHCETSNKRENYSRILRKELTAYGLSVDIYGRCPYFCNSWCAAKDMNFCYTLLQNNYFFYLAFENSMSDDYVTEKVLTATNNLVVPVVYGGANYSRFMPDGMYIDALELSPAELARKINEILDDEEVYYDMFKWHNHYRLLDPDDSPDTNSMCLLCDLLNDKNKKDDIKTYNNIVKWFNERLDWSL